MQVVWLDLIFHCDLSIELSILLVLLRAALRVLSFFFLLPLYE